VTVIYTAGGLRALVRRHALIFRAFSCFLWLKIHSLQGE